MARATVIVQKWVISIGWQYDRGYPEDDEDLALLRAHLLESKGIPARVCKRTPKGPQIIYETKR